MSYPCPTCGYQIGPEKWSKARSILRGLWSASVEVAATSCHLCGHDGYRTQTSYGRVDAAGSLDMCRLSEGQYRCPWLPSSSLDVAYLVHPLPADSAMHAAAMATLADRFSPSSTFLVVEERFGVDVEPYAGFWRVPDDVAGMRTGPYGNAMLELQVSNYVFGRLGDRKVRTFWPSYFRPNFDYMPVLGDDELSRTWTFDFRRRLPIEIKVNP